MKILFGTDGSADANAAAALLAALPLPAETQIRVVSVVSEWAIPTPAYPEGPMVELAQIRLEEEKRAAAAVRHSAAQLQREGLPVTTETPRGEPAYQLLEAANRFGADLLVVGSKGLTGLDGFILGSVARNVAKHSCTPVLVAHAPKNGLQVILVAVDESEHARHAVQYAAALPLPEQTKFLVAHVVKPYHPYAGLVPTDPEAFQREVEEVRGHRYAAGERLVERMRAPLLATGRGAETAVLEGDPTEEILTLAAERGADLIVAGARGVSLIQGLLVGSVADRLLKQADRAVLLVR